MGQYSNSKYNKTTFPEAKLGLSALQPGSTGQPNYHSRHHTHNQAFNALSGQGNLTSQLQPKQQKKLLEEDHYKNLPTGEGATFFNLQK